MSKISKIKKAASKITKQVSQQQLNKSDQQQQKRPDNENIIIQVDELTHSIMESLINSESGGNGSELDAIVAEQARKISQLEMDLQQCIERIDDLESELSRLKRR